MYILRGAAALSDFRLNKLRYELHQIDCTAERIHSEFVHFVDAAAELDAAQMARLERLLQYGPHAGKTDQQGVLFLVVPRSGTISPWSSKATDIAHNCGLVEVTRIERGVAYYLEFSSEPCSDTKLAVAAVLHDRMVEQVFPELAAAQQLFHHDSPAVATE